MKVILRIVKVFLISLILLLVTGFVYQRLAEKSDREKIPIIGELITLDKTILHLNTSGTGDTTISQLAIKAVLILNE